MQQYDTIFFIRIRIILKYIKLLYRQANIHVDISYSLASRFCRPKQCCLLMASEIVNFSKK